MNLKVKSPLLALFLALSFTAKTHASVTFSIKCEAPNISSLNRFELEQEVDAFEVDPGVFGRLYSVKLNPTITAAGHNSTAQEMKLKLTGTIKKVAATFTKEPFYALQLKSADKKVFAQLNLNYPGKLTSSLRDRDGRVYKASCVTTMKSCLFGGALVDILENEEFTQTELGEELKIIPDFSEDDMPVNTQKLSLTFKDGRLFTAWYTFEDEVDGGNTYGVIEDKNGDIVGTIADSDIYDCKAYR